MEDQVSIERMSQSLYFKTNFVGADPEKLKWLPACLGVQSPETGWRDRKKSNGCKFTLTTKTTWCIYVYIHIHRRNKTLHE